MTSPTQSNSTPGQREAGRDPLQGAYSDTTIPPVPDATGTGLSNSAFDRTSSLEGGEARKEAIARKVEQFGSKLRDRAGQGGRIGAAASSVAGGFEKAGSFIRERDMRSVGDDFNGIIRRNPLQATLIGLGIGFFLGRMGKKGT